MALYKYMSSEFVDTFRDGHIRFQPLSYYQRYEKQRAVGDPHEAMRLFRPKTGLLIHNLTTGQRFALPATFVSSVVANDIFVFCASQRLCETLAVEFECDACVEILDVRRFERKLRAGIRAQPGANALLKRSVSYYENEDPAGVNWALPDAIVMSKRAFYADQEEFRFAYADRRVLKIGSTIQRLQFGEVVPSDVQVIAEPKVIPLGEIRSISKVHSWHIT